MRALALGIGAVTLAILVLAQPLLIGHPPVPLVSGLADFRPAWNHGVSFSLLTQGSDSGRYVLMAFLAVISVGVGVMGWRAEHKLAAIGYGLILGGALGNLIDRARFGAVFDFLFLHLGSMPLFVCNLPDIAISAGVVLLLVEIVLSGNKRGARDFAG